MSNDIPKTFAIDEFLDKIDEMIFTINGLIQNVKELDERLTKVENELKVNADSVIAEYIRYRSSE